MGSWAEIVSVKGSEGLFAVGVLCSGVHKFLFIIVLVGKILKPREDFNIKQPF